MARRGHHRRGDSRFVGRRIGTGGSAQATRLERPAHQPLQVSTATTANVFLFTSSDCPISNRYAPEYRRLNEAFESRGVRFWLVYPNPADSPEVVRAHLNTF